MAARFIPTVERESIDLVSVFHHRLRASADDSYIVTATLQVCMCLCIHQRRRTDPH